MGSVCGKFQQTLTRTRQRVHTKKTVIINFASNHKKWNNSKIDQEVDLEFSDFIKLTSLVFPSPHFDLILIEKISFDSRQRDSSKE